MKDLTNLFKNNNQTLNFDQIKISVSSPEQIRSWSFGEIKNQKQLIIEHLNLKERVCSVLEFLDQLKTMNAYAVSTKE